jgi:alpha-glucosidase
MRMRCRRPASLVILAPILLLFHFPVLAQMNGSETSGITEFSTLPNGIEIRSGEIREVILALRDDVLRIRAVRSGALPEDASWAVLATARQGSVAVVPENNLDHVGFRTRDLLVEVDRKTMLMTVRDSSGNIVEQDARPVRFTGDGFNVYKSMPIDEHYFGLGDKTGPLDRRDQCFTLWNTDAYRFQESTDPLYKSIPFFITFRAGRALGVLLDNTWRSKFDFGKGLPGIYSFGAVNGPLDYYLLYGPAPKHVIESYAWLTGPPPLPPLWSLGYQQSRYSYYPQSKVLEIADRLRADKIPADAIYLDIDYQEKNRPFTVNQERFPDFTGMIAKLKTENFHLVAITDLHIAKLPNHGYSPYDSGIAGDHFVKNPDGSVYSGIVWPGPSVFPDFTRKQTREWWGSLYRTFLDEGIAGFWNDMNEPSVFNVASKTMPEDVVHRIDEPGFIKRTATHAEIHDVYGMENSRATFEGLKALDPDLRPFVLTRATYAGGQRYAATWTGDNSSTWNHLRLTTSMLENLGLSGFAFSGADVGGYAGTATPDLLTKWMEISTFQPIDRDHTEKGTGDQEPWIGDPKQEAIRRHYIEQRYRLMPYLYTLAEESSRTGLPMVRPLFLEFPDAAADGHPLDVDLPASGEFLLGSDLLIAPSPFPEQPDDYAAELPSWEWYNYWTGDKISLPETPAGKRTPSVSPAGQLPLAVHIHPELASLPVFVRGGAILPVEPLVQSTDEIPQGPLTLKVYAGSHCGGDLYLDDGKTYAYLHGAYLRMKFNCEITPDGLRLQIGAHEGSYPAWWKQICVELYGWVPTQSSARVNGSAAPIVIEHHGQGAVLTVTDDGKGVELQLK